MQVVRVKAPGSGTLPTNILLLAKGVAKIKATGGEVFLRVPIEDAHHQGVAPSDVLNTHNDFLDIFGGGPEVARNAKQTLTPAADCTSGSYSLKFKGETSADIAYNAEAAAVQAALEALSTIGAGNVEVTGDGFNDAGAAFTVEFIGDLAGLKIVDLIEFVNDDMDQTVAVAHSVIGAPAFDCPPDLDLCGVYQYDSSITEVTDGGTSLKKLVKVEWPRNMGT